ncbi:acyl carrier protein [Streptomyces radicis]|uniref:acyl carrier protein n=1 Tax=Streptomyces radicis TaxID=1750517 RepID=UPI001C7CF3E6|nr:acyl carrier protein [Streptomyces radicis]
MSEKAIVESVAEIVEEVTGIPAGQVTPEKHLIEDLDIDSLALIEVAVAVGEKFKVELSDDELKELHTVGDVVERVRKATITA